MLPFHVVFEMDLLNGTEITQVAVEGLLPRVPPDVGVEVGLLRGSEGAVGAGKGLLPRVRAEVVLQGVQFPSHVAAVGAFVARDRPVPGVVASLDRRSGSFLWLACVGSTAHHL